MTFEQLQAEAERQGFKLEKRAEPYDGEPRSDFSAGSDDEQSDSARWRAEQRILNNEHDLY